jgi:GNAT superfamily N-acetyltransferase
VHFVKLTARGSKEVDLLNKLSDEAAAHLLDPLSEKQKVAITEAMAAVERLISISALSLEIEDPRSEDAIYALKQYYAELSKRFDRGFNPRLSISAEPHELIPPNGFFLIARIDGEPVGCGALKCHSHFGEIKRMWVADSVRGLGIGKRILVKLEEIARKQKLPLLRLETNKTLSEAKALYASHGYKEVPAFNNEQYAHHWFEKKLNPVPGKSRGGH